MGPLSQAGGRKRRGTDFARPGCSCRVRLCPFPPVALEKLCVALSQWGLDPGCGPVKFNGLSIEPVHGPC